MITVQNVPSWPIYLKSYKTRKINAIVLNVERSCIVFAIARWLFFFFFFYFIFFFKFVCISCFDSSMHCICQRWMFCPTKGTRAEMQIDLTLEIETIKQDKTSHSYFCFETKAVLVQYLQIWSWSSISYLTNEIRSHIKNTHTQL